MEKLEKLERRKEIDKIRSEIFEDVKKTELAVKTDTLHSLIEEEQFLESKASYENIGFFNLVIDYQINSFIDTGRNDYSKFTSVAKLLRLIKVLEDLHNQE